MENQTKKNGTPRSLIRIIARILLSLFLLLLVLYIGLAFYIHTHRQQVLNSVTASLNESLAGTLKVGNMETTLLQGFPNISLQLDNVTLRDSLYEKHRRTFLQAGEVLVSVNTFALMRGAVQVKRIKINNAAIDLYTAKDGYSNTSVFRKKDKPGGEGKKKPLLPELKRLQLNKVKFIADNRKAGKLHEFALNSLNARVNYDDNGWQADIDIDALAKSMAFNAAKGSFIKNKELEGSFYITYSDANAFLDFEKRHLNIGGEDFVIGAKIGVGASSAFSITIENEAILWRNAAALLSPNITKKLMMFDIGKPIKVACDLVGDFNEQGDPLIQVNAFVNDNELITPGGTISNCKFSGVFTNNRISGRGYDDINSAIKLFGLEGNYNSVPFRMPKVEIRNLEKPIAEGSVSSAFPIKRLANMVDDGLLKFTKGDIKAAIRFRADVEHFKLVKPYVKGKITVTNADVTYVPRKLRFNNVSVALNFTQDNLYISEIVLKTGKSIINMNGSIGNFLNLYYTDPDKIVLNWNIYSPQLHLGEFMAFLQTRKKAQKNIKNKVVNKGNVTDDLDVLFEKSTVDMKLKIDKLYYKKFFATNAKANVLLTDKGGIIIKNAGLRHSGGLLAVNGSAVPGEATRYNLQATVSNTDVSKLLYAFDNFGLESLSPKNLKGLFSATADVTGTISQNGALLPRSIHGEINFNLKEGKLVNFDPVVSVGKFAFPFRDVKNIEFKELNGRFSLKGEKVEVYPMQISSSILNMDIEGIYSFGKGTQLYIDVPLRNPKKDEDITDEKKLAERRNRGIVVHLVAEDDKDGKVKVKLGKKKDK